MTTEQTEILIIDVNLEGIEQKVTSLQDPYAKIVAALGLLLSKDYEPSLMFFHLLGKYEENLMETLRLASKEWPEMLKDDSTTLDTPGLFQEVEKADHIMHFVGAAEAVLRLKYGNETQPPPAVQAILELAHVTVPLLDKLSIRVIDGHAVHICKCGMLDGHAAHVCAVCGEKMEMEN